MTITLPKKAACVFVFNTEGQLLCVTRRNTDIFSLPGGKVDDVESDVSAAVRETLEETGVSLHSEHLFPVFSEILPGSDGNDFLCTTFLYTRIMSSGNFNQQWTIEEGIKCSFIDVEKLLNTGAFREYNKRVFENVNRIPFFKEFLRETHQVTADAPR